MTYPGQGPEVFPVAGHGFMRLNASVAVLLRFILPLLSRGQVAHSTLLFRGFLTLGVEGLTFGARTFVDLAFGVRIFFALDDELR